MLTKMCSGPIISSVTVDVTDQLAVIVQQSISKMQNRHYEAQLPPSAPSHQGPARLFLLNMCLRRHTSMLLHEVDQSTGI